MDARLDSRLSQAWRCTACGRFFVFTRQRRNPRECQACGPTQLVPASPNLSFWRLVDG
jgi:hypothetical protein